MGTALESAPKARDPGLLRKKKPKVDNKAGEKSAPHSSRGNVGENSTNGVCIGENSTNGMYFGKNSTNGMYICKNNTNRVYIGKNSTNGKYFGENSNNTVTGCISVKIVLTECISRWLKV